MKTIVTLLSMLVIIITSIYLTHDVQVRGKAKTYVLSIYVAAIILWPSIWELLLKDHAYSRSSLPSLLWPIVILGLEIYLLKYHRLENEMKQNKGILSMDANALCTLTFALASILSAHKNKCCQNLFIYGVLGCILFVMPTINAPPETLESIIIQTIQKVCLTYSTSLLIAGAFILHDPINVNNQKQ